MKEYKVRLFIKRPFGDIEENEVTIFAHDKDELEERIAFWKALVDADEAKAELVG